MDDDTGIIQGLFDNGCVLFGSFILKTGLECPFYIDMRESSMNPTLFDRIANYVAHNLQEHMHPSEAAAAADHHDNEQKALGKKELALAGVPYGAVPLAAVVANKLKLAYYPVRKELKGHGHAVDVDSYPNHSFVLIEDVITSGSSIEETMLKLNKGNDNKVVQVYVIINREQGGIDTLRKRYPNVLIDYLFEVTHIFQTLADCGKIDQQTLAKCLNWLSARHTASK